MRTPTEILTEYRARVDEARELTHEWLAAVDQLRRIELAAMVEASRDVSNALMTEYRDACAARARELKIAREKWSAGIRWPI